MQDGEKVSVIAEELLVDEVEEELVKVEKVLVEVEEELVEEEELFVEEEGALSHPLKK